MKIGVVYGNEFIQEIMEFIINDLKMKKSNTLISNDLLLKFEINKLKVFSILPNSELLNFLSIKTLMVMIGQTENINKIRALINSKIKEIDQN